MTALTTFTSSVDVEELVPVELIDDFVAALERPVRIGTALAFSRSGQGTVPVRFPRWNALSADPAVRAGGETDIFVDVDITTTESSITPAFYGFRLPFPDEVGMNTSGKVPALALIEALAAMENVIDAAVLGVTTSSTNQTGAVTDTYDLARFFADKVVYRSLNIPDAPTAMVLGRLAFGEFESALLSNGATLAPGGDLDFGLTQGFRGSIHGINVFESNNVATETTGHSGTITPLGRAGALGIVMNEMPNLRPSRGDDAEQRATLYVVVRSMFGVGLINPRRNLEILTA